MPALPLDCLPGVIIAISIIMILDGLFGLWLICLVAFQLIRPDQGVLGCECQRWSRLLALQSGYGQRHELRLSPSRASILAYEQLDTAGAPR